MTIRLRSDNILLFSVAAALGIFPFLRGGWDLWSQTAVQLFLLAAAGLWLLARLYGGFLPAVWRANPFILLIIAAGWASCFCSPVRYLAFAGFKWWLCGISLILLVPFLDAQKRRFIDASIHISGWMLAALAAYQHFFLKEISSSAFFNPNVFAGYLVMLIPLLLGKGAWFQALMMLYVMSWTHSRGAWFALTLALVAYTALKKGHIYKLTAVAVALIAAAVVYKTDVSSLSDRAVWWKTAWDMICAKPWAGFGPGAFSFVYPAFHKPAIAGISSVYAHSYPLQFIAEMGSVCAILWFGWIAARLRHIKGAVKWAVISVLILSLQDYILNVPANFMLFCYLLSDGLEYDGKIFLKSAGVKLLTALSILAIGISLGQSISEGWRIEKSLLSAKALAEEGKSGIALNSLDLIVKTSPANPLPPLLAAKIREKDAIERKDRSGLILSAVDYERALRLNPFRPATYGELAGIYEKTGNLQLKADVYARRALYIKW